MRSCAELESQLSGFGPSPSALHSLVAENEADNPPLGDFLAKYRQYKDDTLTLSSWLAENALKCGFDIKPGAAPSTNTTKVGGGRVKGKDRKKAKEAAAKSSSAATASGPQ
ncbi:uncharacterized protein PG986_013766 [Apiospora aurea]|uniref:DUF6604 domain-containing protein n=1 Tax=Apiospora aurea TaxID=335848 RepID=A0ABR1PWJ8_9PEZI